MPKPPYLSNPEGLSLQDCVDACEVLRIDAALTEFATKQFISLRSLGEQRISIYVLAEREDVAASTVRRKLKQLTDLGLLTETKTREAVSGGKVRQVSIYTFAHPSSKRISERRSRAEEAVARLSRGVPQVDRTELTAELDDQRELGLYIDMMMSLLFPVLSYSKKDSSSSRQITLTTNWGERIPVSATAQSGTPVARVSDLIAWAALLSVCLDDLRERQASGRGLDNNFVIRGALLGRHLKVAKIQSLREMLLRLNNTQINLDRMPAHIMQRWGVEETYIHTSFIYELKEARLKNKEPSDDSREHMGSWVFQFQLPHHVYRLLVTKLAEMKVKLFRLSADLLSEDNNVLLGLYLYCRQTLTSVDKRIELSIDDLHRKIAPTMARHEFCRSLGRGIEKLYSREAQHNVPLRIHVDANGEANPVDPFPPRGIGEGRVSKHLPREANVECYGFIVIVSEERVFLEPNASDELVGVTSEPERRRLMKGSSASKQIDLLGTLDDVDMNF